MRRQKSIFHRGILDKIDFFFALCDKKINFFKKDKKKHYTLKKTQRENSQVK